MHVVLLIEPHQEKLIKKLKVHVDAVYVQKGSGWLDINQILSEMQASVSKLIYLHAAPDNDEEILYGGSRSLY